MISFYFISAASQNAGSTTGEASPSAIKIAEHKKKAEEALARMRKINRQLKEIKPLPMVKVKTYDVEGMEARIRELEEQLARRPAGNEELEDENEKLHEMVEELMEMNTPSQQMINALKEEIESLNAKLAKAQQNEKELTQLRELTKSISAFPENELNKIKREKALQEEKINALEKEKAAEKEKNENILKTIVEQDVELKKLRQDVEKLTQSLEFAKGEAEKEKQEKQELNKKFAEQAAYIINAKEEANRKLKNRGGTTTSAEQKKLAEEIMGLKAENESLRAELTKAKENLAQERAEANERERVRSKKAAQDKAEFDFLNKQLKEEVEKIKAENEQIKNDQMNKEREADTQRLENEKINHRNLELQGFITEATAKMTEANQARDAALKESDEKNEILVQMKQRLAEAKERYETLKEQQDRALVPEIAKAQIEVGNLNARNEKLQQELAAQQVAQEEDSQSFREELEERVAQNKAQEAQIQQLTAAKDALNEQIAKLNERVEQLGNTATGQIISKLQDQVAEIKDKNQKDIEALKKRIAFSIVKTHTGPILDYKNKGNQIDQIAAFVGDKDNIRELIKNIYEVARENYDAKKWSDVDKFFEALENSYPKPPETRRQSGVTTGRPSTSGSLRSATPPRGGAASSPQAKQPVSRSSKNVGRQANTGTLLRKRRASQEVERLIPVSPASSDPDVSPIKKESPGGISSPQIKRSPSSGSDVFNSSSGGETIQGV